MSKTFTSQKKKQTKKRCDFRIIENPVDIVFLHIGSYFMCQIHIRVTNSIDFWKTKWQNTEMGCIHLTGNELLNLIDDVKIDKLCIQLHIMEFLHKQTEKSIFINIFLSI